MMSEPENTTDTGHFNLATSTLLSASEDVAAKPGYSKKYNPLDQLLDSDDDSDNESKETATKLVPVTATSVPSTVNKQKDSLSEEAALSTASSPAPEHRKSPVKMSAVARLAMERRKAQALSGGLSLSDSDSDDAGGVQTPSTKRQISSFASMRVNSDSDSDPEFTSVTKQQGQDTSDGSIKVTKEATTTKKKERRPPKPKGEDGGKARAASKAAMAMIHEESARLIRETAVAINPMDYTQPLELHDFFAKFDKMMVQRTQGTRRMRNIAAALAKSNPKGASVVQCDSDGDDYELDIVDNCATPVPNNPMTNNRKMKSPVLKTEDKVSVNKGGELESILKYGSQPIHHTTGQSSELRGMRRTDGSRALRDLNNALLDAMYKDEKTGPKSAKVTVDKAAITVKEEIYGAYGSDKDADVAMDGETSDDSEDQDSSAETDDEQESGGESGDEAVINEAKGSSIFMPRKHRAVVVSDDDDGDGDGDDEEMDVANQQAPNTKDAPAKPTTSSKSKFLSMFKMPAPKPATTSTTPKAPPPRTGPDPLREPQQSSYSMTSEQNEDSITGSQDPLYLLSSQVDQINTQDSLLMTPDPLPDNVDNIVEYGTQLAIGSDAHRIFASQQSERDATATQSTQAMQPTQGMQSTQSTQLTADAVADGGDAFSSLPTLVRKALVLNQGNQETMGYADDAATSDTSLPLPLNAAESRPQLPEVAQHQETTEASSPLPKPVTGGRRLLRHHGNANKTYDPANSSKTSKLSRTKKRAIRSEFVEAEAEEGESTDSDSEAGGVARHSKFNWGEDPSTNNKADDGDDEGDDDLDMDTDEEEAALLADPMINNEVVEDRKADQAIRDLHRQQDLEQDEQDIQDLVKDINTGRLRNRSAVGGGRTGFALADDEDYNDRQTRAERMEERLRLRRKLQAREIHDTNLAEIAKNPETAAFAQAALMRPSTHGSGYQSANEDTDDGFLSGNDAFDLEEHVDDHAIATTVQTHLSRMHRRIDSDAESDNEGGKQSPLVVADKRGSGVRASTGGGGGGGGGRRIVGPAKDPTDGSQLSVASTSSFFDFGDEDGGGDLDGDVFTSVAVEKLIVRRRTLMTASSGADAGSSSSVNGAWPTPQMRGPRAMLKRPGVTLAGTSTKRVNASSNIAGSRGDPLVE
ncbi:hypothetical protein EV178_005189 [Coemansia sp. RSA 1646]|nr:hypothetical protein EV178_005189 [Coemansia sp. RSA 1646]KAJ1770295.1 hypothetical protein LPJ74_003299 [Coemansia sp. RSA 1843]